MIAYIPLLIALLGLIIYLAAAIPKAAELGRIAFAVGLLATLLPLAGKLVHLL